MKINQVEELVGITKKNIRFYEDQDLIHPDRNSQNGYREYSTTDVDLLLKIKFLRKLNIPLEEIRKLEQHHLSLEDCMKRHMILIEHEEKNLGVVKDICSDISTSNIDFSSLNASEFLEEMEKLEKEGNRFMNIEKQDQTKKKLGTTIAAIVFSGFMIALMFLMVWANIQDPMPIGLFIVMLLIPAAIIVGVLLSLKQRFKEIEGGEENEASKY